MKATINNTPILIFAALLPLVLGLTFFMFTGNTNSDMREEPGTVQWTLRIDETTFHSDTLGRLSAKLYSESQGERRSVILATLILQITRELKDTDRATPPELTDILRNLSLEHPDNVIRRSAYEAMLVAMESETQTSQTEHNLVAN